MSIRSWLAIRTTLTLVVVVGLAVDAYLHLDLASNYDPIKTSTLSQGDLFRGEGVVAILAALAVAVRSRRYTALIALLVSASALAVLLANRYIDIKSIGPIPSMYEPVWYTKKTITAYAEAVATIAAAALLAVSHQQVRRSTH